MIGMTIKDVLSITQGRLITSEEKLVSVAGAITAEGNQIFLHSSSMFFLSHKRVDKTSAFNRGIDMVHDSEK
jgi:hypothetical protein